MSSHDSTLDDACRKLLQDGKNLVTIHEDGILVVISGVEMADSHVEIHASEPMDIAKRFSPYLGMILGASAIYWLVIWVACVAATKSHLGDTAAQIAGALVATVVVVGGMFAYARWVCTGMSKSRL